MLAGELRPGPGIATYSFRDRSYRRLTPGGARPLWLPGGQEILYSDAGRLRIVHVATGTIRDVSSPPGVSSMSLSADGRTLVFSDRKTQADVWVMSIEPQAR